MSLLEIVKEIDICYNQAKMGGVEMLTEQQIEMAVQKLKNSPKIMNFMPDVIPKPGETLMFALQGCTGGHRPKWTPEKFMQVFWSDLKNAYMALNMVENIQNGLSRDYYANEIKLFASVVDIGFAESPDITEAKSTIYDVGEQYCTMKEYFSDDVFLSRLIECIEAYEPTL